MAASFCCFEQCYEVVKPRLKFGLSSADDLKVAFKATLRMLAAVGVSQFRAWQALRVASSSCCFEQCNEVVNSAEMARGRCMLLGVCNVPARIVVGRALLTRAAGR